MQKKIQDWASPGVSPALDAVLEGEWMEKIFQTVVYIMYIKGDFYKDYFNWLCAFF